jgi:hypothetical protein
MVKSDDFDHFMDSSGGDMKSNFSMILVAAYFACPIQAIAAQETSGVPVQAGGWQEQRDFIEQQIKQKEGEAEQINRELGVRRQLMEVLGRQDASTVNLAAMQSQLADEVRALEGKSQALAIALNNFQQILARLDQARPVAEQQAVADPSACAADKGEGKPAGNDVVSDCTLFGTKLTTLLKAPNSFYGPEPKENDESIKAPRPVGWALVERAANAASSYLFDRSDASGLGGVSLSAQDDKTEIGIKLARSWAGKYLRCKEKQKTCSDEGVSVTGDKGYSYTLSGGIIAKAADSFGALYSGGEGKGFEDNVQFSLGLTRIGYRPRSPDAIRSSLARGQAELVKKCIAEQDGKETKPDAEQKAALCSGEALGRWAANNPDKAIKNIYDKALWASDAAPDWDWGIDGKLGWQAFTYSRFGSTAAEDLDATKPFGYAEHETAKLVWSANAHIGKFGIYRSSAKPGQWDSLAPQVPRLYGAALVEIGQEYKYAKGSEDQIRCLPGNVIACSKVNIAAPEESTFYRLGLMSKVHFAGVPFAGGLAIAPKLTLDVNSGQFAYDVPVLFITDDKGGIHAGLRFSDQMGGKNPDKFSAGIFITKAFKVGFSDE